MTLRRRRCPPRRKRWPLPRALRPPHAPAHPDAGQPVPHRRPVDCAGDGHRRHSSLNLRSLPDLSGEIVLRLYKKQRLLVLERCEEEGWVRVRTDAAEGYVMESYLSAE